MRINSITNTLNYRYNFNKNEKKQVQQQNSYKYTSNPMANMPYYPVFLGQIAKDMATFYPKIEAKMPTRYRNYLNSADDKFIFTPLEAWRNAYEKLLEAKTVEDVKTLIPDEELFKDLVPINKVNTNKGILKVYNEFKEIFSDGILKSGEDFVVYIVRKIFYDAKLMDEINQDLENDLNTDLKNEFIRKREERIKNKETNKNETGEIKDAENEDEDNDLRYINGGLFKDLGIHFPDRDFWNSLKFTRAGYSDAFGEKISKALSERWDKLTPEQQKEEIETKCQGLEEWWNSLSYEQQMALATGVDENDDAYNEYKHYVKAHHIQPKEVINDVPEYEVQKPKKKTKRKLNLKNKDVFNLWMHHNLEKYYNTRTEEEKRYIDIRRSQAQARFWKDMTPEQRIEFINKIKSGIEPVRYAMLDTWNHSMILIRTLSEYLKEQRLLVPPSTYFDSSVFIRFQSKVMTEFWAQNRDLAEKFGNRLAYAHQKVEEAIKNGTFDDLKKQIDDEKKERIRILEKEYEAEQAEVKKAEEEIIKAKEAAIPINDREYRKEFTEIYKKAIDKYGYLPVDYTKEMTEIFLDRFPKDIVIRYGNALKSKQPVPKDVMDYIIAEQEKNDSPRAEHIKRALEAAIAAEIVSKGADPVIFEYDVNKLTSILNERYNNPAVPQERRIDLKKIEQSYKTFVKELSDNEANTLANTYFAAKRELTRDENAMFERYINSYGRSIRILFSDKSAYLNTVKYHFNNKFLRLMPDKIKEYLHIYIQTMEDLEEETDISNLTTHIYKRFKYIPDDILKIYTREIANSIRLDRETHENGTLEDFKSEFYGKKGATIGQVLPGFEKVNLPKEDKFKVLALEQAMADEFYKVSKSEEIYERHYEQLLNFYDMLSGMEYGKAMTLHKSDGTKMFTVNEKPNLHILRPKYLDYLNKIKSNKQLNNPDGTINKEALLYCLSKNPGYPVKDAGTMKRINEYFPAQESAEVQKQTQAISETEIKSIFNSKDYKNEFRIEYARLNNPKNILPNNYIREMSEIILETFSKEELENYMLNSSSGKMFSNEVLRTKCSAENLKKLTRIQHAIEAAIAAELVAKGGDPSLYGETAETLIAELEKQEIGEGRRKQHKINTDNIQDKYNYYKRNLLQGDMIYIVNNYFLADNPTPELDKKTMEFIDEYGKSLEILFSVDISLPIAAKEAFNKKFLNSMPQDIKDNVRPLLKTKEDFKTNYDIEIVRRQLAKRFDFVIPQEPLNIYTREAARMMRLMEQPDADPELKRDYSIENFKKSISREEDRANGSLSSVLTLPKYCITNDSSKLHLLAMEQALADELYRVSNKNNIIYKYDLEELALWFEIGSTISKDNKQGIAVNNEDNDDGFVIKSKPNKENLVQRYIKYMKNFNESENLYFEDGQLNREEILYCLNPDEEIKERDDATKIRIDKYFAED